MMAIRIFFSVELDTYSLVRAVVITSIHFTLKPLGLSLSLTLYFPVAGWKGRAQTRSRVRESPPVWKRFLFSFSVVHKKYQRCRITRAFLTASLYFIYYRDEKSQWIKMRLLFDDRSRIELPVTALCPNLRKRRSYNDRWSECFWQVKSIVWINRAKQRKQCVNWAFSR